MCSLFLEENEIMFTIFIEEYFPFLRKKVTVHGTPIHKTARSVRRRFAALFCSLTGVHFVLLICQIFMQA